MDAEGKNKGDEGYMLLAAGARWLSISAKRRRIFTREVFRPAGSRKGGFFFGLL